MSSLGVGVICAVLASALFSIGLLLQSVEARASSAEHALHLSLIGELVRRPRWVLGGGVMLLGFGFHVAALVNAPLTAVQPALAAGLLVLLAVGLWTHQERIGPREAWGVSGVLGGVVALTFTAPVRVEGKAVDVEPVAASLGVLAVATLVPHVLAVLRARRGGPGTLLVTFGAGAGFALTGLTTKLLSDRLAVGSWLAATLWLGVTAAVATLAIVDQTSALQRRGAIEVGPIVFVVPVVVPVLLAPALVDEGWSTARFGALPLVLSLVAVCAGAWLLSSSPRVAVAGAEPPVPGPRPEAERPTGRARQVA